MIIDLDIYASVHWENMYGADIGPKGSWIFEAIKGSSRNCSA